MKPRVVIALAIYVAAACLVSALAFVAKRIAPETGLVRSVYSQAGFAGAPIEERAVDINLEFLKTRLELPTQFFGVRWRGFLFLDTPQSIEFFAGGNDHVELRVNGDLLLRRNLTEGMRTMGRTVALEAGSHEVAVDYEQFGGSMSLNIQRAIAGGTPGPFAATEVFTQPVNGLEAWISKGGLWLDRIAPVLWMGLPVMLMISAAPWAIGRWRATGAPRNVRGYARRVWIVAAPALLGPAVLFALGPHTIFATNRDEFAVTFGGLALPWLLRAVLINWIILLAAGCAIALLSERLTRMYAAVLFVFGLLLWGQGHLWNPDYGVLAGREIDLSEHAWRARYELGAWGIGLLLALALFRPISRIAPFAALVFMGVQASAAAFTYVEPAASQRPRWIEPPPEIYQFSRTRNVIHIVLDEFQSDVFEEILQQDRSTLDRQFSGFQFFADHAGAFPTTSFSMAAMLTGREYRNDKPAPEFVREAFKEASIFAKVSEAGYDVDAMSIVPVASFEEWLGPEATPNWKGARFRIRKPFVSQEDYREASARQLLELSAFRHVPHSAKAWMIRRPEPFSRALWMDRRESPAQVRAHEASNSVAFMEHYTSAMSVGRERPVYKLLHVGVPHRPIVVDRECRFLGITDMSRQTYADQSRCAIRLVAAILDRARFLGIYDSSLIIVSSDHGTDLRPLGFNGKSESLSLTPGPSTVQLRDIVGPAKALMMIKPPNRTGPISSSDAPTSHVDLQPTILDLIGLQGGSEDSQMFRRDPGQPRRRMYGMYNPHQRFPKGYLDRVDVLSIDGHVVDAAARNVQRLIWRPDVRLASRDVDLGPRRPGNYYLGPGWSFERREATTGSGEVTFVQPLTNRAFLSASLPPGAVDLVLRASSPPAGELQAIGVEVDGRPAARLNPSGPEGYRDMVIAVPSDPARPAVSQIALQFESGGRDAFVFKLDRLMIRDR